MKRVFGDKGKDIDRRTFVRRLTAGSALLAAGSLVARRGVAWAKAEPPVSKELAAELKRLFGNRPIADGKAILGLETPQIAENGRVVPITVEVKKPTPIKSLYVFGEKNPVPLVGKFHFGAAAESAYLATNIRLAKSSRVRVVAELKNGNLIEIANQVKVTIGGCGG